MQRNGRRPLANLPLALGGMVAGHALAYALAYPIGAVRDAHLDQTGHEGFPVLLLTGLLGSAAAILWLGIHSIRHAPATPSARTLLLLQVPAFALLELGERGFDVAAFARDPAVVLGVLLQVVLAFVIAATARGAIAVGRRLARTPLRPARTPSRSFRLRLAEPAGPDAIAIGLRRAPPAPSLV
jgi:hypothetical protein